MAGLGRTARTVARNLLRTVSPLVGQVSNALDTGPSVAMRVERQLLRQARRVESPLCGHSPADELGCRKPYSFLSNPCNWRCTLIVSAISMNLTRY